MSDVVARNRARGWSTEQDADVTAPRDERWVAAGLAGAGLGLIALALVVIAVAYLPELYATPRYDANRLGPWWAVTIGFLALFAVSAGLYLIALRLAAQLRPTPARLVIAIGLPAICGMVLTLAYPLFSRDIYFNVFGGRILSVYHANPFVVPPARFPQDSLSGLTDWRGLTTPYGPLWALVSGATTWLAGDGLLANLLALKLLSFVAFLACTVLIVLLLRRLWPERVLAGIILWAWNPLVLLESAGSAHNDVVMLMFVLIGVNFAVRRRSTPALAALTLAFCLKYVAIILIPLALVFFAANGRGLRDGMRALLPGASLSAGIAFVLFAPFWVGEKTLGFLSESTFYHGSPLALGRSLMFQAGVRQDSALRLAAMLGAGVAYLWLLRVARRGTADLLWACFAALVVTLVVWPFFEPWYVLWVVALAAVIGIGSPARQAVVFSLVALLSYLLQFSLRQAVHYPPEVWSDLTAVVVFGTLAIMLLRRRARRTASSVDVVTISPVG